MRKAEIRNEGVLSGLLQVEEKWKEVISRMEADKNENLRKGTVGNLVLESTRESASNGRKGGGEEESCCEQKEKTGEKTRSVR